MDKECSTLFRMLDTLGLDKKDQQYCAKKMMSIAIRSTYYIFSAVEIMNAQIQNSQVFDN